MSKFLDRILGVHEEDIFEDDYECDSYFARQIRKDNELKEKLFKDEDLTFDEFTRLLDITTQKFRDSFGCFNSDYEIVFRKKNKPQPKKKKESGKNKDEK